MSQPCPYVVGLTGGIGCGKSTVARLFEAHGVSVIDTDVLAHELTGAGGAAMPMLREAFGPVIVAANGALDRAAMRQMAFADAQLRQRLEAILHPMIRDHAEALLTQAEGDYAMLVVPLLVESEYFRKRCNRIVAVECSEAVQIARVKARNGLGEDEIRRIIQAQASPAARRAIADELIDNDGGLAALQIQVDELHKRLSMRAQAQRSQQSVL
ncbi:dephospho-CoA kinase [Uliginosibacterium gangwonense]|uniref:dephospho-CoA kinase n=1 Tax=Uliginosibacterium gangwonense TaxID=392736 RepID=UPI000372DA65|nr:dephospho-CoA kinase [Uliginosibacterium gangwonense]